MSYKIVSYDSNLKRKAQRLRNAGNLSETLLWLRLKKRQMRGFDFHRQKPLGHYIVDFYCPKLKLAIEIDGSSHHEKLGADQERERHIGALGVCILRFRDEDVRHNLNGVILAIQSWVDENGCSQK